MPVSLERLIRSVILCFVVVVFLIDFSLSGHTCQVAKFLGKSEGIIRTDRSLGPNITKDAFSKLNQTVNIFMVLAEAKVLENVTVGRFR